jgi:hypothetical protein
MPNRMRRVLSRNGLRLRGAELRRDGASTGRGEAESDRAMTFSALYSFAFSNSFSSVMNSPMSRKWRYTDAKRT